MFCGTDLRGSHCAPHCLGNVSGPICIRIGKYENKLLATVATDCITGTLDAFLDDHSQLFERLITTLVTMVVIDQLEVVNVDYEH
ncbi:hypothetical protein LCGC14_0034680 [marine sediment metagenome]|uniref:Uncharacterized protein n=1 Tax=marine sediment metagenome TaxID=412755 RepID=A0A0F9VY62_9ZZZZ